MLTILSLLGNSLTGVYSTIYQSIGLNTLLFTTPRNPINKLPSPQIFSEEKSRISISTPTLARIFSITAPIPTNRLLFGLYCNTPNSSARASDVIPILAHSIVYNPSKCTNVIGVVGYTSILTFNKKHYQYHKSYCHNHMTETHHNIRIP